MYLWVALERAAPPSCKSSLSLFARCLFKRMRKFSRIRSFLDTALSYRSKRGSRAWLLLLVALGLHGNVQAVTNIRFHDTDRDGRISAGEYRDYLLRQLRVSRSVLDRDDDGEISAAEIEALSGALDSINDRVDSFEIDTPDGLELHAFAEQEGLLESPEDAPGSWSARWGVLVRGNLESLSLFSDAKPLNSASSATVSYSQDFNDKQSWSTIKGVLMRPVRFDSRPNLIFLPSVSLNRTSYNKPSTSGTDTLILRAAIDRLYTLPSVESVQNLNFRVNPAYITDSRFDSAIVSAELRLQPMATGLGIGQTIPAGAFQFHWLPNIFSEYGRVLRQEDSSEEKSRFFRIGPGIELEIWLREFRRLRASLSAQHLLSLKPESRSRKNIELAVALGLDNSGHLALQLKYVNGDSSAKLEDEHFWTLGLGVKY